MLFWVKCPNIILDFVSYVHDMECVAGCVLVTNIYSEYNNPNYVEGSGKGVRQKVKVTWMTKEEITTIMATNIR